ncbi:U-box domain-containing protein 9-like [Salvia splendens]|uniref:U-box domain-containing protein 9-like n=1 Tax=Salvia splendens TaxID=180675 RepID=UPI001C27ACDD|nr:U-box domain-containing protein 9-like [Salvia splendens]
MDERDGEIIMKVVDWKKRMRERLQDVLGVEGDLSLDKLDKTRDILVALKRLKLNKDEDTISFEVPERFKCPLSKKLMRDPVLLSTGLTDDREELLKSEDLIHTPPSPIIRNQRMRGMISTWCQNRAIEIIPRCNPETQDFICMMQMISSASSLKKQLEYAVKVENVTHFSHSRVKFLESEDSVVVLVRVLSEASTKHEDLREKILEIFWNICIDNETKKRVAETPGAIELLVDNTRHGNNSMLRTHAISTLELLSKLDSIKEIIGQCGVFHYLIDQLGAHGEWDRADAVGLIRDLCTIPNNIKRAIDEGLIEALVEYIDGGGESTMSLMFYLLETLSLDINVTRRICNINLDVNPIQWLFSTIKYAGTPTTRGRILAILYNILCNHDDMWRMINSMEMSYGKLSLLLQEGTPEVSLNASRILELVARLKAG